MDNILNFNTVKLLGINIIFDIFISIKYNSLVCICNNKHIIKNTTNINIFDIKINSNSTEYKPEFISLNDFYVYETDTKNIKDYLFDGFDIEICIIRDFPESVNNVTIKLGEFNININIAPLDMRFHNKKCLIKE